jgi:hypothetical protein
MPWFVCFEIAPKNAFGIWQRLGKTSDKLTADDAVAEIAPIMKRKYGEAIRLVDVYQYQENEQ